MKRSTTRLERMLADAVALTDDELLELHRVLSITASRIRLRDPEYRRRYAAGVAAAQYVRGDGAAIAARTAPRRPHLEVVQ